MTQNALYAIPRKYPELSLKDERRLIAQAQKGSSKCLEELVLRHISFVVFRLRKKLFPEYLKRFGEDLLSDSIPILYAKIKTYNLKYRDRKGNPKPVKFVSYIWKRIDGFIIDYVQKELDREKILRQEDLETYNRKVCL